MLEILRNSQILNYSDRFYESLHTLRFGRTTTAIVKRNLDCNDTKFAVSASDNLGDVLGVCGSIAPGREDQSSVCVRSGIALKRNAQCNMNVNL